MTKVVANDRDIHSCLQEGDRATEQIPAVGIKPLPVFAAPRPSSVVVGIKIHVLSDSIRIALAASVAKNSKRGFSVQDARASAIRLGVVTVLLEAYGRNSQQWLSTSGAQVMLKADDKNVQPLTFAEYRAAGIANTAEMWNWRNYFAFAFPTDTVRQGPRCSGAPTCAVSEFVFSAIEGAQKLTVVVIGNDGHSQEKAADPKLFEAR